MLEQFLPPLIRNLAVATVAVVFIWSAATCAITKNRTFGIRISETLKTDQGWEAAHKRAIPYLWVVLGICVAAMIGLFVLAIQSESEEVIGTVAVGGYLLVLIVIILCGAAGHKAAKAVNTALGV